MHKIRFNILVRSKSQINMLFQATSKKFGDML